MEWEIDGGKHILSIRSQLSIFQMYRFIIKNAQKNSKFVKHCSREKIASLSKSIKDIAQRSNFLRLVFTLNWTSKNMSKDDAKSGDKVCTRLNTTAETRRFLPLFNKMCLKNSTHSFFCISMPFCGLHLALLS